MVWTSIQDFKGAGRLGMEFVCIRLVSIVTSHGSFISLPAYYLLHKYLRTYIWSYIGVLSCFALTALFHRTHYLIIAKNIIQHSDIHIFVHWGIMDI